MATSILKIPYNSISNTVIPLKYRKSSNNVNPPITMEKTSIIPANYALKNPMTPVSSNTVKFNNNYGNISNIYRKYS